MIKFSKNIKRKKSSQRQLQIGELLRKKLANIFSYNKIKNEILEEYIITVSEVIVRPDLKMAIVYVLPLGGVNADNVIKILSINTPYIRSILAKLLHLKYVPMLNFLKDTAFDNKIIIDKLFNDPRIIQDLKNDI